MRTAFSHNAMWLTIRWFSSYNGCVMWNADYYYADPQSFPKRWTPLITQGQIVQLVTVTVLWMITPSVCPEFASFPTEHTGEFYTPQVFVPLYILMFILFYFKRFDSGAKRGGEKKTD